MESQQIRKATLESLAASFHQFSKPAAITLTFKQSIRIYRQFNGQRVYLSDYEPIDASKASNSVREFLKRLSRYVLKRKKFEQGARIPSIAVMEVGGVSGQGRLHYHLTVDLEGKPISIEKIREIWRKVKFAYDNVDVQLGCDSGWVFYSVKKIGKLQNENAEVDWFNCVPRGKSVPKAITA